MTDPIDPNPPYGPPAWPQPPTGYPPQPPPGYPPQPVNYPTQPAPFAEPPPLPPPPSKRGLVTLIVALCTAVLVATGVGAYFLFRSSTSTPVRIAIPASFDGYVRLDNAASHRAESMMRGLMSGTEAAGLFDRAAIGVYAKDSGDQPRMFVFTLPTGALQSKAAATGFTNGVLASIGSSTAFPSGAHGGVNRCGASQFGAAAETVCAWSDDRTTGMMLTVASLTPPALARVENDFRDLVD